MAFRIRGGERLNAGAFGAALGDASEAIKIEPGNASGFQLRAQIRVGLKDLDGAIADFGQAIALNPRAIVAFNGRGHVHILAGNTTLAIADFTQAIALNPQSAVAYNNRGLAHRKAGDLDRALADYTEAIVRNPIYSLAYNNRGYVRESLSNKAAAAADFRRALQLDPSLIGAKEGLARLGEDAALAAESGRLSTEGKALVEAHCSRCHAVSGEGQSPNAKAPAFRLLHTRHPVQALREPLTRGIAAPHDEMPKFILDEGQIDRIVAYINSLNAGK